MYYLTFPLYIPVQCTDTFSGKMANSVPCCSLRTVKKQSLKTRHFIKSILQKAGFLVVTVMIEGKPFPVTHFLILSRQE